MTENEKRLRGWLTTYQQHGTLTDLARGYLDGIIAEHRAALSAARAEALETINAALDEAGVPTEADEAEMGRACDTAGRVTLLGRARDNWKTQAEREKERGDRRRAEALEEGAKAISAAFEADEDVSPQDVLRTLITTPVPASIPVERVREVLVNHLDDGDQRFAILADLGVPLDAAQEGGRIENGLQSPSLKGLRATQPGDEPEGPVTHRRSGAQWAACGANGPIIHLSSNPADVTCEDSRCALPSTCGGCAHRIHAPGLCLTADGSCECRWTP